MLGSHGNRGNLGTERGIGSGGSEPVLTAMLNPQSANHSEDGLDQRGATNIIIRAAIRGNRSIVDVDKEPGGRSSRLLRTKG